MYSRELLVGRKKLKVEINFYLCLSLIFRTKYNTITSDIRLHCNKTEQTSEFDKCIATSVDETGSHLKKITGGLLGFIQLPPRIVCTH